MLIGSTLGRLAVTRARAEAVIGQLDSRLKSSERELRTGAADHDRTRALTDECASLVGIARSWGADYARRRWFESRPGVLVPSTSTLSVS